MSEFGVDDVDQRYGLFLQLLMSMVEAQAGQRIPTGYEWQNDGQSLARQMVFHLNTIRSLRAGTELVIGDQRGVVVDHGSINVLARAVIEGFIAFAYIFCDADAEVCQFRHMIWVFAGLMDRQKRIATLAESRAKQEQEKLQADAIRGRIEGHPMYQVLEKWQKKALIQKADWSMGRPWRDLAVAVGLHADHFRNIYSYLCDYSHSSYAAALQVRDAVTHDVQRFLSRAIVQSLLMVMAHFIVRYAEMFPLAKGVLDNSAQRLWVDRYRFTPEDFDRFYSSTP